MTSEIKRLLASEKESSTSSLTRRCLCAGKEMSERKDIQVPSPNLEKLLNIIDGYRTSKAVFAACDLGIFDQLHTASAPQSASEMSQAISSDLDATTRILDTLVALEFLEKTKHGDQWLYSNSQMAAKFLTSSSPETQLGLMTVKNKIGYPMISNLESAVREGKTQWMKTFGKCSGDIWKELLGSTEESRLEFVRGMHDSSLDACHAVARAFDLGQYSRCCDLGGK